MGKRLLEKESQYAELILRLEEAGIIKVVRKKHTDIDKCFGVPKDGGAKQRLIVEARRSNCLFIEPKYSDPSNLGCFCG